MFTRLLLRYPHIFWLTGFLLPIMYLVYILNLKRVLAYFRNANSTLLLFLLFTVVQLISAILAINYFFFSLERFAAIIHNIFAFTFIFVGYICMQDASLRKHIKKYTYYVFIYASYIVWIATSFSFLFKQEIILPSLFSLINLESKFTLVKLNMLDWYMIDAFPRTQVLGIYPNSTGLLFIFLYVITISLNFKEFSVGKKVWLTMVLVSICFLTGSRAYWLLSMSFFLILLVRSKGYLSIIALLAPIIALSGFVAVEYLSGLRTGSNDARTMIYEGSFHLMMNTNPYFGLGVKPRLPEIIGVPYPLGSHSAIWGYIIKSGMAGALFMLIFIGIPIFRYLEMLMLQLFTRILFNNLRFFILNAIIIIIISLAMEDLDSFEILPFYFGIFLWVYDKREDLANDLMSDV